MEEDKSYQGWSANAEQLRRTSQQIHRTLKNDLKSLNTGMSYQCSLAKDEATQKQNACTSYFERKEHAEMTEETCYMHFRMFSKTRNGEPGTGVWEQVSGNPYEQSGRVVPPIAAAQDTAQRVKAMLLYTFQLHATTC